ncbi:23S rRNA (guanosine(2251)-2'-O)-methyltransferase RlmB [Chitinophaga pendula]|uniref:23S rRNA (guanosine(2251)-2'-O)-methyltransferase RlmB n=1 Tax=Chitinophaga TaxID=79328 RepID=UPI000BAF66B8|nr:MULTISPECIES: 23S rRNA (guanosine(2251)-2'-O)-methyltransferase RlmB [Chitinophaga]ASZ13754.1 23S rRNA (guanosine(2251)-2'-O)-methyltransferase RlmB [Chitinophaga sp. MD30]UCJ08627.1 23S rRNA (guanosine(2251)-2'-O)-methyltransferase RlmB [Chitinophaga pendula]
MEQRKFKSFQRGGTGGARRPAAPKPKASSLIIGRQPILEALNAGKAIERIFMLRTASGDIIPQIRQVAMEKQVPINLVPVEKLNSLSNANHQGCIALVGQVNYLDLQDVISHVTEQGQVPLFLILDGITDVRNIGAIARSAVCCGAQAIIIPDKGIAALNEEAMKSSAGALEKVMVCRVNSLLKAVDTLHLNGISVYASEMEAGQQVYECNWKEPAAIIMGSEDKGVYPALLKASDVQFAIPLQNNFESFNVSVAAGIILYEAMKQRL